MSFRESIEAASEQAEARDGQWYAAYTRPRMEGAALVNLERQGFHAYLPLLKTCRATPEGLQPAYEAMFPRYVFLQPANVRQSLSAVSSTRGVSSLVRTGATPAVVAPELLDAIRELERMRSGAALEDISPMQPGARVRMRKGALKGVEGLVVSAARQRVTFLLQVLGREAQVTVEPGQLELA